MLKKADLDALFMKINRRNPFKQFQCIRIPAFLVRLNKKPKIRELYPINSCKQLQLLRPQTDKK